MISGSFKNVNIKLFELNYHDQKIQQTSTHDIREHRTAVSTLLGLISNVYRNLHHLRSCYILTPAKLSKEEIHLCK